MKLALEAGAAARLLWCLVPTAIGCHDPPSGPSHGLVASELGPTNDDRTVLVRLAQVRSDALVARDEGALTSILAEGFIYTNASGEVLDRAQYLERYVRSPSVRWHAQELEDVAVHRFGETALLTARVHDRATFGTQELDAWFRSTFVYVKTANGWQCVAGHSSSDSQRSTPHDTPAHGE
jgi:ketosteroid isomerase-like protein